MSSLLPSSSRFLCPRPPLSLSARNQNRHATQATENIKNLPLELRSRDKLWASRGYPSLPELRHAFLPHKRWEDYETIAAWLSQSPLACPLLSPLPFASLPTPPPVFALPEGHLIRVWNAGAKIRDFTSISLPPRWAYAYFRRSLASIYLLILVTNV